MTESSSSQQLLPNSKAPLHFVVVVLGDVGRSPRMQYHALSLLQLGDHVTVSLVGYTGEALIEELQAYAAHSSLQQRLHVVRFHVPAPEALRRLRLFYFVWRVVSMSLWLLWALLVRVPSQPDITCILLQNPPALPLLAIALGVSRIKGLTQQKQKRPRVVIDWHNLGFTMLDNSTLRKWAKAYEFYFAPFADGHLTVTKAMKEYLIQQYVIIETPSNSTSNSNVRVLYDCPPAMFQPLDAEGQHSILSKLHTDLTRATPRSWQLQSLDATQETILTTTNTKGSYETRPGRPALVTSSTSWTPDEDFGLLLDALVLLEHKITSSSSTLRVMVVVTGKGPQKQMYEEKISQLALTAVAVKTVWLEPGDYPKLLACADVAVSLHTSTSGLDLPMKILDSYGCHVPVCAREFDCLHELVQDQHNGRVFASATVLAEQLWDLLSPLATTSTSSTASAPHEFGDLAKYSENLKGRTRWTDNWTEQALPVLLSGEQQ